MTKEQWLERGRQLVLDEAAIHWQLGDWINSAAAEWGDRYKMATEATGIAYASLNNYSRLAKEYPPEERRYRLTQSHYLEALRIKDPEARREALEQAESEQLKARVFRMAVSDAVRPVGRFNRRNPWPTQSGAAPSQATALAEGHVVCCPNCGHKFTAYV
jgi:hypothetical protein